MLQNAWLMPRIYPDWECHCFYGFEVPLDTLERLIKLNVKLHPMCLGWAQRMFYRLLIHDVPGVERYLIRDADSRISMRERRCVDQWIESEKILHTIHDHPYHIRPIQGGMFGVWRAQSGMTNMRGAIGPYPSRDEWGLDEQWLQDVMWPLHKHSVCEHGRANPIPAGDDEDPQAFIGEIYDAQGNPEHPEHRAMRK